MPIPDFAPHGALPTFVNGNPTARNARSPFQASVLELVDKFCTTADRARLLKGLNQYRKLLHVEGFVDGFQWVDGSFIENVEVTRRRSPKDIDIISLYHRPLKYTGNAGLWSNDYINILRPKLFDPSNIKPLYSCDCYDIDLDAPTGALIESVRSSV